MTKRKETGQKTGTEPTPTGVERDETHVPEAAENIEHTLSRIAAERMAKREKTPGLYL